MKNRYGETIAEVFEKCLHCGYPVCYRTDSGIVYNNRGWCHSCIEKIFHKKTETISYSDIKQYCLYGLTKLKVTFKHCSGVPCCDWHGNIVRDSFVNDSKPTFEIRFYAYFDYFGNKTRPDFKKELVFVLNLEKCIDTIPSRKTFDSITTAFAKRTKIREKREILSNKDLMNVLYNDLIKFTTQFDFIRTIGI